MKKKIESIVIISTSFPLLLADGREAAGSFVADFAEELSHYKNVHVLVPDNLIKTQKINEQLTIHRFKVPSLPLSILKPYNPAHWLKIAQTMRLGNIALDELVSKNKIDYILALWILPSGYWAMKIGQKHHIPFSNWSLGSDIWTLGKLPIVRSLLRYILNKSQSNFADGYELQSSVEKLSNRHCFYLRSSRSLDIIEEKTISEKPPYRLAFLGRWHKNKGIDILLESLKKLAAKDWNKIEKITIAGGGAMEALVKSSVQDLKQAGHPVIISGFLNKDESIDLILDSDYMLIPSRKDTVPLILSDAMKCSCPVVITPIGDVPKLFNAYSIGSLAADVSIKAYTQAIKLALNSPPSNYSRDLPKVADEFKVSKIVADFLEFIR